MGGFFGEGFFKNLFFFFFFGGGGCYFVLFWFWGFFWGVDVYELGFFFFYTVERRIEKEEQDWAMNFITIRQFLTEFHYDKTI